MSLDYCRFCVIVLLCCPVIALAEDDDKVAPGSSAADSGWLKKIWTTPDERTRKALDRGDYDRLLQHENKTWSGVGHFKKGDYSLAAAAFAESDDAVARYNEATSLVMAGDIDKAIKGFDELLETYPEHQAAQHNRHIASQLKELQQQQEQQQSQSDGGEGDDGDDQNENDQQQQADNSAKDNNSQSQSSEQENNQNSDQDGINEPSTESSGKPDETGNEAPETEQSEQAGDKLADDPDDGSKDGQKDGQKNESQAALSSNVPLSEDEQAVEQWLRRIPDDPRGLLRRKLLKSHQAEYPDVVDSSTPW